MPTKTKTRNWTVEDFARARDEIVAGTAASLRAEINRVYDLLTEDERVKLSIGYSHMTDQDEQFTHRLVKAIILAKGGDVIEKEWNAETLKPKTAQVKRILKRRV